MSLIRIIPIVTVLFCTACEVLPSLDDVVTDQRTEYQKSEALPDLEVPPDLTSERLNDPLAIPNEQATTLSEFERQKSQRRLGGPRIGTASSAEALTGDNWVVVQGDTSEFWPEVRKFWRENGYEMELDDPQLGVMETKWKESDSSSTSRNRFRLFSEEGATPGTTLLLISSEQQEKITEGDDVTWIDTTGNAELERQVIGELNVFLYGTEDAAEDTRIAATSPYDTTTNDIEPARAEVLDLGDEKLYLSLPEEFTRAWRLTEGALLKAGLLIESQDRNKGLYYVIYVGEEEKKEGFFDKIAFWSDDEPEGKPYQISLTGVGDKTELVVLDNDGEWDKSPDATRILSLLQTEYNNGR